MQDVKDRLLAFVSSLKISKAEFERRAGLSNGYLKNFKGQLGADKLEGLLKAFPQLSRVWLLTGEGSMLKNGDPEEKKLAAPEVPAVAGDMVSRLMALVESQQQTIAGQASTIATLTDTNSRLSRLVELYKKEPEPSVAPSLAD